MQGELDMKLLNPVFGYNLAPEGIAHLDLDSAGAGDEFHIDGNAHFEGASYIGTGVNATGIDLAAHVHADPRQMLITSVVARLRQGGQIEGDINLAPWLPPDLSNVKGQPGGRKASRDSVAAVPGTGDRNITRAHSPPWVIPMTGKVTARLTDVALDTILEMVCKPSFQRVGLDTRINGLATANWTNGVARNVAVVTALKLSAPAQVMSGEVPASGFIDATYTQRDGAVDMRKFNLYTPASQFEAQGHLGSYPLSSRTALTFDFHSSNLNEFDAALRDLGLKRYGKTGVAALPISLAGQIDFLHGEWTGSLANPHIAGNLKATQLGIEMLPIKAVAEDKPLPPQNVQPGFVHWDSVDLTGSYEAEQIEILHGLLGRGKSEISLNGSLIAAPGRAPAIDADSLLHLHLHASKVGLDDLLPMTGQSLPLSGALDAQLQLDGPIHSLGGSGWVDLSGVTAYGEPVERIHAQGTLANQVIRFSSITLSGDAGKIDGAGSYDLNTKQFQLDAHGAGIDLAGIEALRHQGLTAAGKLNFKMSGSGTASDPRFEAHAALSSLALGGEQLGTVEFTAQTANRILTYSAVSKLQGAEVNLNGHTELSGDYETQAKLDFSHFDIGALLKMANVQGLTGESALAGTMNLEGPLADRERLRGEVRLQQLTATVAGVHLESQGGVHATLANGRHQS